MLNELENKRASSIFAQIQLPRIFSYSAAHGQFSITVCPVFFFAPASTLNVSCKKTVLNTHKEVAWKPWAPPVMASTATSGLPAPVPIDGEL